MINKGKQVFWEHKVDIFATWEFREGIHEIMSELSLERLRHMNLDQKFRMGFQAVGKGNTK